MNIKGIGTVIYRNDSCIISIDQEIVRYYFSTIPKYCLKQKQKYPAHITVIRNFEKITFDNYRSGDIVTYYYDNFIYENLKYYYIKCWSNDIIEIRKHYGLIGYRFDDCAHITIGNKK